MGSPVLSTGRRGVVLDGRRTAAAASARVPGGGEDAGPGVASETSLPPHPESILRKELGVG
jgi:hypothetical protein